MRHVSLIAPEKLHAVPRSLLLIPLLRPEGVHPCRRAASGESDCESAPIGNRVPQNTKELFESSAAERV